VTFIELIGVLVVAIIIIAGALALYSEANTSSRTNQLVVALGALSGSVRALHANIGRYSPGSGSAQRRNLIDALVNANAVPPGMLVVDIGAAPNDGAEYRIQHAFGGGIFIYGWGQEFTITADMLDQDICIRVATESTAKASSGLQSIRIGRHSNTDPSVPPHPRRPPNNLNLANGLVLYNGPGRVRLRDSIFIYGSTTAGVGAGLPITPVEAEQSCAQAANSNAITWLYQ